MPTTRTRYVNTASTAGGDGSTNSTTGATRAYPTLNAALTAEATNLVTNDRVLEIICEGTAADTEAVSFTGYTTDATRYIYIYTQAGNRALGGYDATKYRLEVGGTVTGCVEINKPHVRIEGLQIVNTQVDPEQGRAIYLNTGAGTSGADIRIIGCVICYKPTGTPTTSGNCQGVRSNIGDNNIRLTVVNNLIYDFRSYGIFINHTGAGGTFVIYNNTICDNAGGGVYAAGNGSTESLFLKNNLICYNTGTQYTIDGSVWNTYTTSKNVTSDTSSPDGASYQSKSPSFVDRPNDNYHLQSGDTACKDLGDDLTADAAYPFNQDIDLGTRTGSWDIGADEQGVGYEGGGGSPGSGTGFGWFSFNGGFLG